MNQYQKIQTVYLRDPETNFKDLLEGEWSKPEFDLLKDIEWEWTEKIDGTNIRVLWDGENVSFGGKTDKADIPAFLLAVLEEKFSPEKLKPIFDDTPNVCLYGEGYGRKIQKGGNYLPDRTDFILFDIKVAEWWLIRESNEDIAKKLETEMVPIVGSGKLLDAIELCKNGFKSVIAINKDYNAEGLVMKPKLELFDRKRDRVITKIKHKDFRK